LSDNEYAANDEILFPEVHLKIPHIFVLSQDFRVTYEVSFLHLPDKWH
jgi:hypothetical protein